MAYGFEVYGTHGRLQIAAGVVNFYMVEKGTLSVSGTAENPNSYLIPATLPYDFYAVGGNVRAVPMGMGDFDIDPNYVYACSSGTLNWYTFRAYSKLSPGTTGYHIEVYDPDSGEVCFTSRFPKIMKSGSRWPITTLVENLGNHTLPSGKTWAFLRYGRVKRNSSYNDDEEIGLQHWPQYPDVQVSGTTLTISLEAKIFGLLPGNIDHETAGGIVAIDVTGY